MATYHEPGRELPVLGDWDVVVCGGGPAGCAAAISAARHGAKTLLLEQSGFLGGATVHQLVVVILSTNGVDFQGIWHEYARELRRREAVRGIQLAGSEHGQIHGTVDPEQVKFVWDRLCSQAGVELLHHCYGCVCLLEDGVARGVSVETKAGRRALLARRVIDCTGDGIVAAQSGVGWDQGDGEHPYAMALTKVFRMANVQRPEGFPNPEAMAHAEQLLDQLIAAGEYDSPVVTEKSRLLGYLRSYAWQLPERRPELMCVISRILKTDPLDPFQMTQAERDGREQARQAADALRRIGPGFEQSYLLDTSNQIGVRSSRRLHGLCTVTDDDAWNCVKRADGIARSSWDLDVWPADSYTKPAVPRGEEWYQARMQRIKQGDYFDIPYGCLVPQGIDNLLIGGRCISAEHRAEASLRIQQTCMATGQAAGTAAALSLAADVTPRKLDPAPLVKQLAADREVEPAFEELAGLPMVEREV